LRVDLGINSAAFSQGLKQAQSGLAKFGSWAKTGLAAAAAGAAAAAAGVGMAVKGAIDEADRLDEIAQKIGVPIEELSRLKYAAELSGTSFDTLQGSLGRLSKGMESGSKAFSEMGIAVKNTDGSLRPAGEVLSDIAARFASMPDGAQKTAEAMKLFGKAGADMIPFLNQGAEGIARLKAEADTFGQVFTAEMGANAGAFNENVDRLSGAIGNVAARIATELLPYLKQFSDWLIQNAPAIAQWSGQVAAGFQFVVNEVIKFRNEAIAFGQQVQAIVQVFTDLDTKIRAFGQSVRTAAAELLTAFAELPAKMMEIGGQIIDGLWQGIQSKWESVKAGVAGIADSITTSIKSTLGIHSPSRVMHEIGTNIMQGLNNGMQSVDVKGGVQDVATGIESTFASIGSSVGEAITGTKKWSAVLKDVLKQVAGSVFSAMGSSSNAGVKGLGSIFSTIFGALPGFANGGSFKVGGAGGIDSQLVAFKASPSETVSISKPGQRSRGGGPSNLNVHVYGATGNQEVQSMVQRGIHSALSDNDMEMRRSKFGSMQAAYTSDKG
jgi:phage-related protein